MLTIKPPARRVSSSYDQRLALESFLITNPHKDNYQFFLFLENPWRDSTPLHSVTCTPLQRDGKPLPSHQHVLAIDSLDGGAKASAKFTLRGDFDSLEVTADEVRLGKLVRGTWPLHKRWAFKPA